jgi:hypothetical protein
MVLFHLQLLRNFNRFNHRFLNAIAASYFRTAGPGKAFEANLGCNLLIFRKEVMNETTGPEEFQDKIKQAKEAAGSAADQAREAQESARKSFERYVKEQPVRAILTAFGAGVILALLMRK